MLHRLVFLQSPKSKALNASVLFQLWLVRVVDEVNLGLIDQASDALVSAELLRPEIKRFVVLVAYSHAFAHVRLLIF